MGRHRRRIRKNQIKGIGKIDIPGFAKFRPAWFADIGKLTFPIPSQPEPKQPPPSLALIIECDPDTLRQQKITTAAELKADIERGFPDAYPRLVEARTWKEFSAFLQECQNQQKKYRVVLVVGHSNHKGIQLASDYAAPWEELGSMLAPLSPQHLLLIACEGGSIVPATSLFRSIVTLRELYGSPVVTRPEEVQMIGTLATYLLRGGIFDNTGWAVAQIGNLLLTEGLIFRWSREEIDGMSSGQAVEQILYEGFLGILKDLGRRRR